MTSFDRKKQIDVSFSGVCLVNDNELRHNIVKVVCYDEIVINNRHMEN